MFLYLSFSPWVEIEIELAKSSFKPYVSSQEQDVVLNVNTFFFFIVVDVVLSKPTVRCLIFRLFLCSEVSVFIIALQTIKEDGYIQKSQYACLINVSVHFLLL